MSACECEFTTEKVSKPLIVVVFVPSGISVNGAHTHMEEEVIRVLLACQRLISRRYHSGDGGGSNGSGGDSESLKVTLHQVNARHVSARALAI